MMKVIKNVGLFPNDNEESLNTYEKLKDYLIDSDYAIDSQNMDLAISIGGDGSFLRMVKNCHFRDDMYYLGINTGTLGFATEIYPDSIEDFIKKLKENKYKEEIISVAEIKIYLDEEIAEFYSLNDIVIRDYQLNTIHLRAYVDDNILEDFAGDGLLISTSFGSSAYNLSFGGSIVYNELHTLQITPIAPLNNKSYRTLLNSVIIPEERRIKIIPQNKEIIITIDGKNKVYNNVKKIEVSVKDKRIKCLRMYDYDYTKKINEKFLKG